MRVPVLGPVVGAYQITATRLALVWRSALLALVAGYLLTLLDYSKLDPIARTAAIRPEDMLGPDAEVYLLLVPMAAAFIVLAANASRHWQQLVVDTARAVWGDS